MEQKEESFIFTSLFEKKEAVEKLREEALPSPELYFLLFSSSLIVTLGLILNNSAVVIGGMLLAPLFSPFLIIGLGIVLSSREIILKNLVILLKMILVAVLTSFLISFIVNIKEPTTEILMRTVSRFEYFLIAFMAGVVGTYFWVKPHLQNLIAGVIIAVALIPPLSVLGIGLTLVSRDVISGSLMFFLLNFVGIIFGSVLMFSLFGFGRTSKKLEETIEKKLEV
jgi:uncharacterized hydrophobic protein (TIGR00271 family)